MPDSALSGLYPAPPQPNANSVLSDPLKLLGALGQVNQLQLFQQHFGARKAIGEAYQKAIRPDGSIDTPTLMREIQARPDASFLAGEASAGALSRQGQQIQNSTALFNQRVAQSNFVASKIAGLADKDNITDEDLHNFVVQASRNVNVPSQVLNGWVRSLPKDPAGRKAAVAQLATTLMTPEGAAAPAVTGYGAGGEAISGTTGQAALIKRGGAPAAVAPADPGTAAVPAPAPAPAPARAPGIVGLPLGTEKSAGLMQEDLAHARNYGQEILPMAQALEAANKLKAKYGTGYFAPGSQGRQEFQSFFYGLSPTLSRWLGVDPEKLKDYAEAKKYLTQATASRVGGFGAGTEAQLKTAAGGSPSVDINDMAVDQVLKMMIAARRMEQVQTMHASKGGAAKYTENASRFATSQAPAAYMIDLMTPDEIAKLNKTLKGADRAKFNASYKAAIEAGVIPHPREQ